VGLAFAETAPEGGAMADTSGSGFTAEERAAMKETAAERRPAKKKLTPAEVEAEVRAKIDRFSEPDRSIAAWLHELVASVAPTLVPRLWYGMPAYSKDGNVVCFFQDRDKFKARYATLGFSDKANLDDGVMWPSSYAITELSDAAEKQIAALVKQAAS
jgi:uncharacterized protein YdhG (YjbR/CyaY superfamily)